MNECHQPSGVGCLLFTCAKKKTKVGITERAALYMVIFFNLKKPMVIFFYLKNPWRLGNDVDVTEYDFNDVRLYKQRQRLGLY